MDFLGIGIPEVVLILVIMLVVLGPKDMVKTGRQIGRLIRRVITSPTWASMMTASREIREFPTRLVRDAGLEEDIQEIRKQTQVTVQIEDPRILDLRKADGKTPVTAASSEETPSLSPPVQGETPPRETSGPQDQTTSSESAIDPQI